VQEGKHKVFEALRYERSGGWLVVKGPISPTTNEASRSIKTIKLHHGENDNHKILHIAAKDIHPVFGTPVICRGLKRAHNLNRKIGDVRGIDDKSQRYKVYFEDPKLKPCLVKPENIKILFELSEKDCA
jgi:hypothetical protein